MTRPAPPVPSGARQLPHPPALPRTVGPPPVTPARTVGPPPVVLPRAVPPVVPPPAVAPLPKQGPAHLTAFVADLRSRTDTFTRGRSSTLGLIEYLEQTKDAPTPFNGMSENEKVQSAKAKCANHTDSRLQKYEPALRALVRVWGSNRPYVQEQAAPQARAAAPAPSRSRAGDIKIAHSVCQALFDVRIADVDFSDNVKAAAKAKKIGRRTLYDIVKEEWETSPDYTQHERLLTTEKANAVVMRQAGLPLKSLDKIAEFVWLKKYAVCESITATVISRCKKAGFGGRMEWIGIPYTSTSGHSIVIAHRTGDLTKPATWGDYFVVDLWYYNLGMRNEYLIDDASARSKYYDSDIKKHIGGVKSMADIT